VEATGSAVPSVKDMDIYRTHYGDKMWQHAMGKADWSAKDVRENLVKDTARLISKYREAIASCKMPEAGFYLGVALHYFHDSWTKSHASRNATTSEITQFFDYGAQSPRLHADAEALLPKDKEFGELVAKTEALFRLAANRDITGIDLKATIRNKLYPLNDDAKSGGAGPYEPRNGSR